MKLSVVIPVYNAKATLAKTVESIAHQNYAEIEIILVDDGSNDGSGALCDTLAERWERVCAVHQPNGGVAAARNNGTQRATGEYITYVDADDLYLDADGVSRLMALADGRNDVVLFKSVDVWGPQQLPTADYDLPHIAAMTSADEIFAHLIASQRLRMSAWTLFVRRQLLTDHAIMFPSGIYSEDIDWVLQLWQHVEHVGVTNVELYGYVHQLTSRSTTSSVKVYESHDQIMQRWAARCDGGCRHAAAIRSYLANLWVNRAYFYSELPPADKPAALMMLRRNKGLLRYAVSTKGRLARSLTALVGVRATALLLSLYHRQSTKQQRNAI